MAAGHDILNQDEQELLLYMGSNVWKMMSQGEKSLPEVTEKILHQVEKNNYKMLDYLDCESEVEFSETVGEIISNYNQPEILRYIVDSLFEEDEEGVEIRDEMRGMIAIYLKTVIDCFDR